MGPIVPGVLDEGVVFAFDRVDAVRPLDDREIPLPRDARDFPQHVPPIRDQVEDMVRGGDIERSRHEGKARRLREDDIPQTFCEAELDHLTRDVHADYANSTFLKRHGVAARADPDLEHPFPLELVHEDREDASHRPGREATRLVINRRDAVEGQAARHRVSHGGLVEKCALRRRPAISAREGCRLRRLVCLEGPDRPVN